VFWNSKLAGYAFCRYNERKRKEKKEYIMVKIIADSTCDLSEELIKKYDISILPLHILLGEEEYEDGKTITPEEIFAWSDAHKTTPKTSAPGLEQALALIRPFVEEEREVICFSISDSMSTSGNVMRLAVEELHADGLVTVIDSENLSTGIGLLVVEAAQMAQEGKAAVEITERIYDLRPRVRASFVVDTLTYLHRGGRCSGVAALAGSVLKLHPKIVVCLGRIAAQRMIRQDFSVTREHGQIINKGGILFMGTFHPAALLRQPQNKPEAFADFTVLRDTIAAVCEHTYHK